MSHDRRMPHWAWIASGIIAIYLLVAYAILPQIGKETARRHPNLIDGARLTHTENGVPGDPLNIALVGSAADVVEAMSAAGWQVADALGCAAMNASSSIPSSINPIRPRP